MTSRNLPMGLFVAALVAAGLTLAPPAGHAAPERASSRMRTLAGRMTVEVPADAEGVVLDSLVHAAAARGYALVSQDPEKMRVRLEKPATLGEVGALGWKYQNTERRWLDFEVVMVKHQPDRLAVVGAITLVQNPGAVDERLEDLGKQEPYRRELRAVLQQVRGELGP